jgi:hypothetical protein
VVEELMDIGKSFSYPFEDKEWISKLGLGAVITIVPVLNLAWSGYMVGIIRNVMNNAAQPLPAWDDLGKKFMDGLILLGAGLVYALPMLLLLCLPMGIMGVSGALSGDSNMQDIAQIMAETGGVLFLCLMCLFVLYSLALSVVYPAILVVFAREGTFASCFKFSEVFAIISRNAGPFFTAWGMTLVTSFGVGLAVGLINGVLSFIPCLGWIAGMVLGLGSGVYAASVYAHLFGQFAGDAFRPDPSLSTP